MSEMNEGAPLHAWLTAPLETAAKAIINRARRAEDVVHVAVMPDVHPANDVCVGTAMATRRLVYPAAVGGDIGCGMLAIAFDAEADLIRNPTHAGALLRHIGESIPIHRRHRARAIEPPADLQADKLSHGSLIAAHSDVGRLQLGTLGGGNHFVEFQSDPDDRLWLMIHSGSRAMGQAVKSHHLARATIRSASMMALDIDRAEGQAYLHDQQWARRYAEANRQAMGETVVALFHDLFRVRSRPESTIRCDHNHVQQENHFGHSLLVHRKGAMPASDNLPGIVPGSMGTLSYHVTGRGNALALRSSAHGAGRSFSRQAARERFTRSDLCQQMNNIWFDPRLADALREESPRSYKDVRSIMRAQADLVTVVRMLRPLLVFKGGK